MSEDISKNRSKDRTNDRLNERFIDRPQSESSDVKSEVNTGTTTLIEEHMRRRGRIEGVKRVVQFNWPIYGVALAVLVVSTFTARSKSPLWRLLSRIVSVGTTLQTIASLAASFWIYDLSRLHRWWWLKDYLSTPVRSVLHIHSGYDESEGAIARCFPDASYAVIDFYPALKKREPSIEKANRLYPPSIKPVSQNLTDWPIEDDSCDLVVIPFAAHELRSREGKLILFNEIAKKLRPGSGRAILIESLRNLPNALAYGPGYFHFFSEREWLECISLSGLVLIEQDRLTPFIGVFVIGRP